MAQPDCILLQFGESQSLAVARHAVFLVALCAVLLAPVDPWWRLGLAVSLPFLHGGIGRKPPGGRIRLYRDGGAKVFEEEGLTDYRRGHGGWVSRWFSVVPLVDPVRRVRRRILVCAAHNSAHDYRRLLGWLRLLQPAKRTGGIFRW
jgi:hypothetical protein